MRLIDADALERDGWRMSRIVQIDEKTMEAQTRKPTDFPAVEPQPEPCEDTISRQSAIQAAECIVDHHAITPYQTMRSAMDHLQRILRGMPSAQPEPLTDKEQRIFLAAMGREEKVCEEVDRNYVREPYEDSLMRVCKEIRRKVKGALWT